MTEPIAREAAQPHRARWPGPRTIALAALLVFAPWLVGQLARDRFWLTALCFYLPSPLAAAWLAVVALVAFVRRRRLVGLGVLALAALPLGAVLAVENQWLRPRASAPAGPTLRLVHWNIWRGRRGWRRVQERLTALQADAYILSEYYEPLDLGELAARLGGDYDALPIANMAVVARGSVAKAAQRDIPHGGAATVLWRWRGVTFTVLLVDIRSNVELPRHPALQAVRRLIGEYCPDFVVGDLNAPRRSLGLAHLPGGYVHAYRAAGAGWSYTWPVPVPLWAIDHCIVGPRIQPLRYTLRTTLLSDHRMQVLDFAVRP